ncbi:MAG: hypothetical protein WBC05_07265 [Sedimentisphaerales bacterium]
MIEYRNYTMWELTTTIPKGGDAWQPVPQLMTQNDLVRFLRIPEISAAKNQHNVIEHLKRYRSLPRIRLCNKTLYPLNAILEWIEKETTDGK